MYIGILSVRCNLQIPIELFFTNIITMAPRSLSRIPFCPTITTYLFAISHNDSTTEQTRTTFLKLKIPIAAQSI